MSVNWATVAGTATAGTDFLAGSGTVTIAAGATSATISVTVLGDARWEPNEGFSVVLSAPVGATIADGTGDVTITNDDPLELSIADASVTEGNSGTKTVTLTVSLSAASTGTVTVKYATGGGTATAGTDYTSTSGTLTFSAGQTSKTFTVTIRGDAVKEPNETFNVTLSSPSGAVIFRGTGVVTILDDEPGSGGAAALAGGTRLSTSALLEPRVAQPDPALSGATAAAALPLASSTTPITAGAKTGCARRGKLGRSYRRWRGSLWSLRAFKPRAFRRPLRRRRGAVGGALRPRPLRSEPARLRPEQVVDDAVHDRVARRLRVDPLEAVAHQERLRGRDRAPTGKPPASVSSQLFALSPLPSGGPTDLPAVEATLERRRRAVGQRHVVEEHAELLRAPSR